MASHTNIFVSQCVWYNESGATIHITSKKEVVSKLAPCDNEIIILGDEGVHEAQGRGEVTMRVSRACIKYIQNVLHILCLKTNLLSINKITDKNYNVVFNIKNRA